MISMDKKYTTRDGRPVRILCVDGPNEKYPVVGFVDGGIQLWYANGYFNLRAYNERDLIEAPETIEVDVWVNVYDKNIVSQPYDTKSYADDGVSDYLKRIACINIKRTVTVGEGL